MTKSDLSSDSSNARNDARLVSSDQILDVWISLDRGWRAVLIGLVVLVMVLSGIEIPW